MIDWVAVAWLASAFVVAALGAYGVRDALSDLRSLGDLSNGRRKVVRMNLVLQAGFLVIGLLWVGVGVTAILDERVTPLSPGVVVLVASNVILAVLSVVLMRIRRSLLQGR